MELFRCFDRCFIINLPARTDRRRDMEHQLRLLGLSAADGIEFFPGIRPDRRDGWPSVGALGCFLSHYNVLRHAIEHDLESVAILEDDCEFGPDFARTQGRLAAELAAHDWGIVHLGHSEPFRADAGHQLQPWHGAVRTTHFYAVHRRAMGRLVDYFQAVLTRPAGHPLGGPQFNDGAMSMFRAQNPDILTLVALPSLARQRSSRSDITARWFDAIPGARGLAGRWRRYRGPS